MKQPIQVRTYVDLDAKGISKRFKETLHNTNRSSAKTGRNMASPIFASKYEGVAPHKPAKFMGVVRQ